MRNFHVIENHCQYCGAIVKRHMLNRKTTCLSCKKAKKSIYDALYSKKDDHLKYHKQFTGFIKCPICGKVKSIPKQQIGKSKYCSVQCAAKVRSKIKPTREECISLYWDHNKSSLDIAKIYNVSQSFITTLFKRYGIKMRDFGGSFKHKKPWNYVNGISKKGRFKDKRSETRYKKLVKNILKRDNYTCRMCGKQGKKLEVDHIIRYSEAPELLFNKHNLQTLCHECHLKKTIEENKKFWKNQYTPQNAKSRN